MASEQSAASSASDTAQLVVAMADLSVEERWSTQLRDLQAAQLRDLQAVAAVEMGRSKARNDLIHCIDNKDHIYPHAIADLRRISARVDAALRDAVPADVSVARAVFVVRLLDFYREHYYMCTKAEQAQIDQCAPIATFVKQLEPAYQLDDAKRKGQLRNFVSQSINPEKAEAQGTRLQKWNPRKAEAQRLINAINGVRGYNAAVAVVHTQFRGTEQYPNGRALVQAAIDQGQITGLTDFGQTLHILKNEHLKTRGGDSTTLVANVRRFCDHFGFEQLFQLGRDIVRASGNLRYLQLVASAEQIEHVLSLETGDKTVYQSAIRRLVVEHWVDDIRDLPDIGALAASDEFLRSFDQQ